MQPLKIVSVVGARPNFVKIASFLRALEANQNLKSLLVHTGQHYDPSLSDVFFKQLGIRHPDFNLEVGSGSHAQQTATVMMKFEPVLLQEKPDAVVVVGDINSTLACALTAQKLQIPVVHIEAGLRSRDNRMPEETNRRVTDLLSDLFFTTSRSANENLIKEGVHSDRIHFAGNLMIDSLFHNIETARRLNTCGQFGLKAKNYALLTLHRPSNVDDPVVLKSLVDTFALIHGRCPILFLAHPRTRKLLAKDTSQSFQLADPVGYQEMLSLQMDARFVLTDSGGIQEETTVLNIPCLTLRENTERPETVSVGSNQVIGSGRTMILAKVDEILNGRGKPGSAPELWDGQTGGRIARILVNYLRQQIQHPEARRPHAA